MLFKELFSHSGSWFEAQNETKLIGIIALNFFTSIRMQCGIIIIREVIEMKNYLTYIIIFIALLLEVVLEGNFPIITLVFLLVITGLILLKTYLIMNKKIMHQLTIIIHYLLIYIMIYWISFVALIFLGYQTTPHTFIIIMLILLSLASLGFVYVHINNAVKFIKQKRDMRIKKELS